MSKKEVYEQKTEEILNPIVEKHGFDLWDVEYVKEGGTGTCVLILISREELWSMTVRL